MRYRISVYEKRKWFPSACLIFFFPSVWLQSSESMSTCSSCFQERISENFISISLTDGRPSPPLRSLKYRYLKPLLPCLGGCDVTGGISNVILVSRRDRSHKCLMSDEALCSSCPDVPRAAHAWRGLFKELPVSIRTRWKPSGAHESGGVCHIHIGVCTSCCEHTHIYTLQLRAVSHTFLRLLLSTSLLLSILFPGSTHTQWAKRVQYCCYWTFIPCGR